MMPETRPLANCQPVRGLLAHSPPTRHNDRDARRGGEGLGAMDTTVGELLLAAEPDAVPRARRFARETIGRSDALADDVELVVAELVTNATLHGAPPIKLRVQQRDDAVRVEVEDTGRHLPIRVATTDDGMTGRGLAL